MNYEIADRVTGIPQRKTPYSRGQGSSAQNTLFGFRRRTVAPNNIPPQSQPTAIQPPTSHVMAAPTGRCSPHFPPTPPVVVHHQNSPVLTNQAAASALPKPLTNRFGFQLSPRCTKVLNNINAQLVNSARVDPNCNPLTLQIDSESQSSLEGQATSTGSVNKTDTVEDLDKISKAPTLQIMKSESRQPSRLPGPKTQVKPIKPARGKPAVVKPVVAKPVVRPMLNKSTKTEVNEMVARQSQEEASNSSFKPQPQEGLVTNIVSSKPTTSCASKTSLELASTLCKQYEQSRSKSLAPTAKPEDLEDLEPDGLEHKVLLDEDVQEKLMDAWPEALADDKSLSYSEGIEEQHIEFPDNLTDKSADSLVSSVSSDSCSEMPPQKDEEKQKKSSGSLSQLSDASSEQRDFLIDDEIADQPVLTFMAEEDGGEQYRDTDYEDEPECPPEEYTDVACSCNGDAKNFTASESQPMDNSKTITEELPASIHGMDEEGGMEEKATPLDAESKSTHSRRHCLHSASTGTLSPCESLTSDDLMLDFEESASKPAHSSAILESKGLDDALRIKQWFSNTSLNKPPSSEDASGEMDNVLQGIFSPNTLAKLHEDRNPEQCYQVARQAWEANNQSKGSTNSVDGSPRPALQYRSRTSSSSDVASSPRGRASRTSPLRPPRSSTGSVLDSEENGIKMDWNLYQGMTQDALAVKTNLLRLRRLLQDAEVTNPFDSSLQQSSNYYNLASCESVEKNEDGEVGMTLCEENADLRRQVVFLQQQMLEKDRTIHLLQQQMSKYCNIPTQPPTGTTACGDDATSTDASSGDGLTACAPTATKVFIVATVEVGTKKMMPELKQLLSPFYFSREIICFPSLIHVFHPINAMSVVDIYGLFCCWCGHSPQEQLSPRVTQMKGDLSSV
ncbi:hypothetical protein B566_EDAN007892 [Ephemera danica]|nr:hypothetical protein B566_EDAN007892 [Ephemera danica]